MLFCSDKSQQAQQTKSSRLMHITHKCMQIATKDRKKKHLFIVRKLQTVFIGKIALENQCHK